MSVNDDECKECGASGLASDLTIYPLLKANAERAPNAPAIAAPGRAPLSYSGLLTQVDGAIEKLHAMGLGPNDPIVVVLPNGPEMAVTFLAVAAAATCAPLNPAYRFKEFDFYFSDLKPRALIVQSGSKSAAVDAARKHLVPLIELTPLIEDEAGAFSLECEGQPAPYRSGVVQENDIALILHTSGTTSRPKMVSLTHANLLVSAGNIAATLQLTRDDRCLNVMPLFHIHGLVGALLSSVLAGSSVVCASGFDAEAFFTWLEQERPTWYTAVPAMHQAVLSSVPAGRGVFQNVSLRFVRSASAPLPPRVAQRLEEIFEAPVIEAYGMTEGAHQIASNPLPPGARKSRSVGLPTGTEIAVFSAAGDPVSCGQVGEIVIRGRSVIVAYAGSSATSNESFTRGWLRTGDRGYLDTDGYLFLTGRLRETINRGGEKISPLEVDEVLKEHPSVSEAVAFAVPHPTLGQDVAAAIVLQEGSSTTGAEIQRFAFTRLSEFKVPRQIFIVASIPRTATGKIQRVGLGERLGLTAASSSPSDSSPSEAAGNASGRQVTGPRTPVEEKLVRIWSQVLGMEVGVDANFFQIGGDSIQAARVISRMRASMGVELPFSAFFETPTIAAMGRILKAAGQGLPPLKPLSLPEDGIVPVAHTQEAIWFFDQLAPGNPAYNRPVSFRLHGQLHLEALERSLNEIVRRHAALRASFPVLGGRPMQRIAALLLLTLPVTDIRHVAEADRETRIQNISSEEARRPFDLACGPLVRALLLRLEEDSHLLLVTTHHIVFDGWSSDIFFQELKTLYEAFSANCPSPLPDLVTQYPDFARWQRELTEGGTLEDQLAYWKRQLDGEWAILSLPTDRPALINETFRGAIRSFVLPEDLSARLKEVSHAEGASLFMTLLAALNALLYRYSGQESITVGTPFAGRNQVETEPLIGCFINTLPLRTDLSGDPTCRELIARVRKVSLEAHANQDIPFEKIAAEIPLRWHGSRSALYQVLFQLRNYPVEVETGGERLTKQEEPHCGTSLVDLSLAVQPQGSVLECRMEYNTDLFEATTIDRIFKHWRALLEGMVTFPDHRISTLPILTEDERSQHIVAWNDTQTDYPVHRSDSIDNNDKRIHELFEAQVERTPNAAAVAFEAEEWTYHEVNVRANRLAHYLMEMGVGPEALVGICLERSLDMVVGLLAILKAGGAYVPLDPAYPKERLAFMLEDTQARVLLTRQLIHEGLIDTMPAPTARVVCLDIESAAIAAKSERNPVSGVKGENLAYVIYTSGSTGHPKGVMISHSAIANHMLWMQKEFPVTEKDRVMQKTPFSFDASVWEFFAPLLGGAELVLARPGGHQDSSYLLKLVAERKITVLQVVPSLLRMLLDHKGIDHKGIEDCSSLRRVFCGGEALSAELQERFFERLTADLHNLYGPTEASIDATVWTCIRGDGRRLVPIGRPISNTQAYILDSNLEPVPVGVPGELHIGGAGLARGYWNRPELTREKFIPDPFRSDSSGRLYKTGDLARFLPDGNIEFLGRMDDQVKVRGFRIELGEIEVALALHSAIQQVAVAAMEDTRGDKQLVAYIVPRPASVPPVNALRDFLKKTLPDYMVPSSFVFLDSLPLTHNGKLDRKALPAIEKSRPGLDQVFRAPRTPTEETLARVWKEVLDLEMIGIHDSFFDLGGHSLLATQVVSRLREGLNIELPLRTLFDNPTVAALAEYIETTLWAGRKQQPAPGDGLEEREELKL